MSTTYVFGPDRSDGVLVHKRDCAHVVDNPTLRPCPDSVVRDLDRATGRYGIERHVGACWACKPARSTVTPDGR